MASACPKLRSDLRIQEADGGRLVKIAHSGMVGAATLSKSQYHLLSLFDGEHTVAEIARDARRLLDQHVITADLESLLETLRSLELVEERQQTKSRPGGLAPADEATDWFGTATVAAGNGLDDVSTRIDFEDLSDGSDGSAAPAKAPAAKPSRRRKDVADLVRAARALRNNDLAEEAAQYAQQALALDPEDKDARALLAELSGPGDKASVTETEELAESDVLVVEEGAAAEEPSAEVQQGEPAEAPEAEAAEQDEAIIEANLRRRRRRWIRLLISLAVLGAIVGALHLIPFELWVNEECRLEPTERVEVRARVKGLLKEVDVREGSVVRKGALLARLDDIEYLSEVRKVQAKIQEAEAELKKLRRGARKEEIAQARQVVATKATEVSYAQLDYRRQATLYGQNLVSKEKLDSSARDLAVKQRELGEAQAALNLLMAGNRKEVIEVQEAELRRLKADLDYKKLQLEFTRVFSPITGRVVTPRLEEKVNTYVNSGTPICEVVDTQTMRAEVFVPERELDALRTGQKVQVRVKSYPERGFWGKVVFIAPRVEKGATNNTLRVLSLLDNPEHLLKPDMTGQAKIYCGKRSLLTLALRRFLRWVRVEFVL